MLPIISGNEPSIPELRTALDRVLSSIESTHGTVITVPHDHYWHLPVGAAFNMTQEPQSLTVGQVSDDIPEVRNLLNGGDETVAAWHELQHVIGVLRALEAVTTP